MDRLFFSVPFFEHTNEFRQWEQMNYKNQNYAINKDHYCLEADKNRHIL